MRSSLPMLESSSVSSQLPAKSVDKRYKHVVSIEDCPQVPLTSSSLLDSVDSPGPMGAGEVNFRQWRGIGDTHDLLEGEMVAVKFDSLFSS